MRTASKDRGAWGARTLRCGHTQTFRLLTQVAWSGDSAICLVCDAPQQVVEVDGRPVRPRAGEPIFAEL